MIHAEPIPPLNCLLLKFLHERVSVTMRYSTGHVLSFYEKINLLTLVFTIFFSIHLASGQEAGLKTSPYDVGERINFIQSAFDKSQKTAKVWSYTWMAAYGAAAGFQTYQAIHTHHDRATNIVGASESFIGLAVLVVDPFYARSSGDDLREIPESTPEEQKYKLKKAEEWLERNYKQEKFGRSWLSHVGVIAASLIGAGIVRHYDGSKNAIITGLSNMVGGELLIWTQPTRGIKDYKEYHSRFKGRIPERKYFIAPSANGLVVGIIF